MINPILIMLQFSGVLSNSARLTQPRMTWCRITQQLHSSLSSANPVILTTQEQKCSTSQTVDKVGKKSTLVEAAIKNANDESLSLSSDALKNENIVNNILSDLEKSCFSLEKIVPAFTTLTNMIRVKKIDISKVLNDKRFIQLLNCLSKKDKVVSMSDNNDFSATSQLSNACHIDSYIMILKNMGFKKYRNVPTIKDTAKAIINADQKLDIKQGADILYSLATICFPHEELINKVCKDLIEVIPNNKKRAVIRSIITSLGMLQYKDCEILDVLSLWIEQNWQTVKCEDIVTLMMTLATLGYVPKNDVTLFEKNIPTLRKEDMTQYEQWLNLVWSLMILNRVNLKQISSVLNDSFIVIFSELSIPLKQKLLNINAGAKLIYKHTYDGSFLDENSDTMKLSLTNRSEKVNFIKSVVDPLKSLLPSSSIVRKDVDTKMGFLLDIECLIDDKCYRMLCPTSKKEIQEPFKIAVVTQGYHDFTRGVQGLSGICLFQCKLLELAGYKVLQIPYTEYDLNTKLISRLKYLRKRLTDILVEE